MNGIVRFFVVLPPWHPVIAWTLAAVVLSGAALVAAGITRPVDVLAPVLLLQALGASSGFAGPARRGHYDFLLAGGHKRLWIGVVHWVASAAPGVAAWLLVVLVEFVTRADGPVASLSVGAATGMFLVSSLSWAVTVALPRLTAGLIWMAVVTAAAAMLPTRLAAVAAYPWVFARDGVGGSLVAPATVALLAAGGAVAAALSWIHRADLPLETAQ